MKNSSDTLDEIKASNEHSHDKFAKKYQIVCDRLRELTNALDAKDKIIDDLEVYYHPLKHPSESIYGCSFGVRR